MDIFAIKYVSIVLYLIIFGLLINPSLNDITFLNIMAIFCYSVVESIFIFYGGLICETLEYNRKKLSEINFIYNLVIISAISTLISILHIFINIIVSKI